MPSSAPSSASPPPPRSARWAIFGKLAYDEGATVGTLLAVRFVARRRAALGARRRHGRRAPPARAARAATSRIALALGAHRLQRPGRRATSPRSSASTRRCSRCSLYTFPAIVAVAAIALGRERASRRTAVALGARLDRAGARPGRRRGRARSTRSARRSGSRAAVVYSTYILTSEGVAERVGPLALERAGLHRRGDDADARPALVGGDLHLGARERDGLRLAGRHRRRLDGRRRSACSSPACARRPDGRRRSSRRSSRSSTVALAFAGLRRVARPGAARRRRARPRRGAARPRSGARGRVCTTDGGR